jgi:S1/P1 Nuclease
MKQLLLAPVMLLLIASPAFGWGNEGHQAIAEAAQSALSDRASTALAQMLFATDRLPPGALASVATWPDEVRARAAFGTVAPGWDDAAKHEADKFNSDHKTNALWHFVNLPLGAAGYKDPGTLSPGDPMRAFVGPDDIVQAMKQCITILESQTAPGDFSKAQAVRWLVDLVGDIHQTNARYDRVLRHDARGILDSPCPYRRSLRRVVERCAGGSRWEWSALFDQRGQ